MQGKELTFQTCFQPHILEHLRVLRFRQNPPKYELLDPPTAKNCFPHVQTLRIVNGVQFPRLEFPIPSGRTQAERFPARRGRVHALPEFSLGGFVQGLQTRAAEQSQLSFFWRRSQPFWPSVGNSLMRRKIFEIASFGSSWIIAIGCRIGRNGEKAGG